MEAIMANDSTKSFRSETYILLVDDDLVMLDSLAETLKYFAYQVTLARTGREALALLSDENKKFNLVLMEARLASANQCFLIQETFRMDIPIILMSDGQSSMDSMKAIQDGAYFYLEKPISLVYANSLWEHAMTAKLSMQNMKHKGMDGIEVMNVNVSGESSRKRKRKYSCTKSTEKLEEHFAFNAYQPGYTDQGKASYNEWSDKMFATDAYEQYHEDCYLEENFTTMNYEYNLPYSHIQKRHMIGTMPFLGISMNNPEPSPSQENEGTYKVPSFENNLGNDDDFDAFIENNLPNFDDLAAIFESFEPFSPNLVGQSNITIPNTAEVTPNPNELINNQVPGTEDIESFPFGFDSLFFDEPGDGSGF